MIHRRPETSHVNTRSTRQPPDQLPLRVLQNRSIRELFVLLNLSMPPLPLITYAYLCTFFDLSPGFCHRAVPKATAFRSSRRTNAESHTIMSLKDRNSPCCCNTRFRTVPLVSGTAKVSKSRPPHTFYQACQKRRSTGTLQHRSTGILHIVCSMPTHILHQGTTSDTTATQTTPNPHIHINYT